MGKDRYGYLGEATMTRLIGVVGRSFTGSTLLSKLFWCAPGVASPGETHWLVDDPSRTECMVCHERCPILTPKFRSSEFTEKSLYARIAEQFATDVLVVSEVQRQRYEVFCKPGSMDAVILHKSPFGFVASDLRRKVYSVDEARFTLNHYKEVYGDILEWARRFCNRYVVVEYESLAEDHSAMMHAIFASLDLDDGVVPEDLQKIDYHYIYGSQHTHAAQTVRVDGRWKTELGEPLQSVIRQDTEAMDLHRRLVDASISIA